MKRIYTVFMLAGSLCLTGCTMNKGKKEEALKTAFEEEIASLNTYDPEYVRTLLENNEIEAVVPGLSQKIADLPSLQEYLSVFFSQREFTYDITEIDIDQNTVSFTYNTEDLQSLFQDYYMLLLSHEAYDEENDVSLEECDEIMQEVIAKEYPASFSSGSAVMKFKEENGTYTAVQNTFIIDYGTAGMSSLFQEFSDQDTYDQYYARAALINSFRYETEEYDQGMILKVFNDNDQNLMIKTMISFYDDHHQRTGSGSVYCCVNADSYTYIPFECIGTDYKHHAYASYEITFDEPTVSMPVLDQECFELVYETDDNNNVSCTVTNTSTHTASNTMVYAFFRKDGETAGYSSSSIGSLKSKESAEVSLKAPYDDDFARIPYDTYELYVYSVSAGN